MAEVTMHLTPYQFGMNSPVMYNDPTGLISQNRSANYMILQDENSFANTQAYAQRRQDYFLGNAGSSEGFSFFDVFGSASGAYNASQMASNASFWTDVLSSVNDSQFGGHVNFSGRTIYSFDAYSQAESWAAGVATYSGTITTQMVSDYYSAIWAGTGRSVSNVRESPTRSGFNVGYADYTNTPNHVIVGSMFVSTAKMKEHLDGNGSRLNITATFTFGAQAEFDFNEGTLHAGGGIAVDLLGVRDNKGVAFATMDGNARAAYVRRFGTVEVIKIAGVSYTVTEKSC